MTVRLLLPLVALVVGMPAAAGEVYRCPGNAFTNSISAKDAIERGCRTIDGAPITIVHGTKVYAKAAPAAVRSAAASRGDLAAAGGERVSTQEQKQRDSEARVILESELSAEQDRLAAMQKDFNGGQPERHGDERNAQKYLDRIEEMRAAIARKEADIAALRRELSKLPS